LYDVSTCLAIVRAARAGVKVQIVLSGETRFGYEGTAKRVLQCLQMFYLLDVLPPDSMPVPKRNPNSNRRLSQLFHSIPERGQIDKWVDIMLGPDSIVDERNLGFSLWTENAAAIAPFNSKVKLATLYYSDDSQAANHSKVYIIDEDCFYVGSDNMYVSAHKEGLQEFGYLIEDQKETRKFIAEYWNQLWQYSGKHPLN
jgi:phosphatidylserine/phosphatidylglycerophosphate/cardiolipin synthase-like enzyme